MHPDTRFLFIASMDIDPDKEDLFNEVYDTEHVPLILKVPGVLGATRSRKETLTLILGGEKKQVESPGEPRYSATYELTGPEVLVSDAWANALEAGRWPGQVRPFTRNRRHVLQQVLRGRQ